MATINPLTSRFLTVYCSSSDKLPAPFPEITRELGEKMVQNGFDLVYGGATVGLMGILSRTVKERGGKVIGVIPKSIHKRGIANTKVDKLIISTDMHERKATMAELAEGFIALPGGFGTLEEILEIITLKQLQYHNKPIVFLNVDGCFDALLQQFEYTISHNFAKPISREMYYVADSVDAALAYIRAYKPKTRENKWF